MKFEKLYERAKILGCDYIVTGHYARIEKEDDKFVLKKALDETKDQSYALYSMTQEQLARTIFPLGNMRKTEVRAIAEESGFANADKPDSQDICFVPNGDYARVIEMHTGKQYPRGNFVDKHGNIVLGSNDDLFSHEMNVANFNWISGVVPHGEFRCKAKIRYRQVEQWATVIPTGEDTIHIIFDEPQRAITPGQAAVLYDDELVVGGGVII